MTRNSNRKSAARSRAASTGSSYSTARRATSGASRKCQVCNNTTRNPSGLCYLHEAAGARGTGSHTPAVPAPVRSGGSRSGAAPEWVNALRDHGDSTYTISVPMKLDSSEFETDDEEFDYLETHYGLTIDREPLDVPSDSWNDGDSVYRVRDKAGALMECFDRDVEDGSNYVTADAYTSSGKGSAQHEADFYARKASLN